MTARDVFPVLFILSLSKDFSKPRLVFRFSNKFYYELRKITLSEVEGLLKERTLKF